MQNDSQIGDAKFRREPRKQSRLWPLFVPRREYELDRSRRQASTDQHAIVRHPSESLLGSKDVAIERPGLANVPNAYCKAEIRRREFPIDEQFCPLGWNAFR